MRIRKIFLNPFLNIQRVEIMIDSRAENHENEEEFVLKC